MAVAGGRARARPGGLGITKGDPSVVVGVVDTGVKPSVADVAENLVAGWDFVTNDGGTRDDYGHGTLVASVIAARGDNGTGIAGYCWYCKVMPVRVSDWTTPTNPRSRPASGMPSITGRES